MPLSPQQELELLRLRKKKALSTQQMNQVDTAAPVASQPVQPEQVAQPAPKPVNYDNAAVITQSMNRGLADLAGTPVDLVTMGLNALSGLTNAGADKVGGLFDYDPPNIPAITKPFLGSDSIADMASGAADMMGIATIDPATLKGGDKYLYNMGRFGAGAGAGGLGLASRAGKATTAVGQAMTEPYVANAGRQIVDDVIAGAGAGAGSTVAENVAPDSPMAQLFGALMGGGAASVGSRATEATVKAYPNRRYNNQEVRLPDGSTETRRTVKDAAALTQTIASDPKKASQNIKEASRAAEDAGMTKLTSGLAADDVGLGALEVGERTRNKVPYMERDQAIRTDITKSVDDLRDPNADIEAPQRFARQEFDRQIGEVTDKANIAQKRVSEAKQQQVNLDREKEALVSPITAQRGRSGEASKALDEQLDTTLNERTKIKNDAFDQAAGDKLVDAKPIADSVNKVEAELNELGVENTGLPADFVKKVRKVMTQDPESKMGAGQMVNLKDVSRVRRDITSAIGRARKAGNYDLVDNLSTLKSDINKMVDETASFDEAQKYYREEYAPFFAQGYGRKYRDTVQRATERTDSADPAKIASIFLDGTPDAAGDLKRIVDIAPDKVAAESAVERYMAADLAYRIGDTPSPRVLSNWIKDRSAQLDQFPEVKKKFENLQKKLGSKEIQGDELEAQIDQLKNEFRRAEKDILVTTRRINKGVLGTLINKDPDKYVKSIMGADDRLKQIDDLNKMIGKNEQAKSGFKRAVTDYLIDTVTGTNVKMVDGGDGPIQYAQIAKVMKNNEDALSKVYSPSDMNALRRAQKMLASYGNLARKGVASGSDTAEKISHKGALTALETGLRVKYGVLKTGGIIRTLKGAAELLPDSRAAKADKLIAKAMLDPDVAVHLLDTPISEVGKPKWNKKLNLLIAGSAAVREDIDSDENSQ